MTSTDDIAETALEQFERHGSDISVADIAAAAHVSPRTFFRHFPTKEDAILLAHRANVHNFETRLAEADGSDVVQSLIVATRAAIKPVLSREIDRRRYRLIFATPVLRARMAASDLDHLRLATDHLSASLDPIRAAMTAAAGLAAVNHTLERFAGDDSAEDCLQTLTFGLSQLDALAGPHHPDVRRFVVLAETHLSQEDLIASLRRTQGVS